MEQPIEIGGLWRSRFYADLYDITEPIKEALISAINYCHKIEVTDSHYSGEAQENITVFMDVLEMLFPQIYEEMFSNDESIPLH